MQLNRFLVLIVFLFAQVVIVIFVLEKKHRKALTDHALRSVFAQLPIDTCPKKRLVYTNPELWEHASRHCIHWTGEKPWKFQKRRDLQDLTPLWYQYLREHVPNYKKPSSDFKPKK